MESKRPFLSVVIPAFNEERLLPGTLNSILNYLKKQSYSWEVIVSDDGSSDHTRELVLEFQKSFPELILVDNQINRGKGFAVKEGVLRSRGELVLFMDADNSTKINEIEKAFPLLNGGADIVIGSRRLKESKISRTQPFFRRLGGEFFRILTKLIFDFHYNDTQAGFKIFSEKAKKLFQYQITSRWSFDVEILWLAKKMGFKVVEIPIEWSDNLNSRVKLTQAIKFPFELLKIRFRKYHLWSAGIN